MEIYIAIYNLFERYILVKIPIIYFNRIISIYFIKMIIRKNLRFIIKSVHLYSFFYTENNINGY